jgi:hypothetical protein
VKPSSVTPRASRLAYCATALALVFAAMPAVVYGQETTCEPRQQRDDNTTPFGGDASNPCNGDNFAFEGTFRNQFRAETKRNGKECRTEFRNRDRVDGQGQGAFAEYKIVDDHTTVTRMVGDTETRFKEHHDQRIIAQEPTELGKSTNQVASWFNTARTDIRRDNNGNVTKDRVEHRCRCKRDDTTDACPEETQTQSNPSNPLTVPVL